jgi:3-phenylpropionate/trans-cinnamate dioxygenase ferredoxin reductase subunit
MTATKGMVIVGAGEAGARAAVELRDQGWSGAITLIGKEVQPPYERPPLSKYVLTTDEAPEIKTILNDEQLANQQIQSILGIPVHKIDSVNHQVHLVNGDSIGYERLLLATGANPRRLMLNGEEPNGALYLRTYTDALDIRAHLQPNKHIVIIGAGFIGLEVAASARTRGCEVTVIEVGPRILMRGVPVEIAEVIDARHRQAGVNFKLGVGIKHIERRTDQYQITLADETEVKCDTLIIGIGAVPETKLAEVSGLHLENGIAVNEQLITSDPDIFAAGDCCSFPHPLYGGKRIRLEAWRNAQDQATHAAINMLGAQEAYRVVPWFWSDQYDLTLQVAGLSDAGTTTVKRGQDNGDAIYFHLTDQGRILAASAVGSPAIAKDIRLSEMLIEKHAIVDPQQLADPSVKLKSILQQL